MSIFDNVAGYAQKTVQGLLGDIATTIGTPTFEGQLPPQQDWRVRLALAPNSNYLYKAEYAGILSPLLRTNGVIFPYTPNISVTYAANYEAADPTHSNYKIFQYKNSSVDQISITCDFTAQDTYEATYLLAVIHFFRSATKMFYGQDQGPRAGTPPPLCFLHGLGAFQFDEHPLVINNFTYTLPTDVDYIRAGPGATLAGEQTSDPEQPKEDTRSGLEKLGSLVRLAGRVLPGGNPPPPVFSPPRSNYRLPGTFVPTKISMSISAYPVVSRNEISNNFSLRDYANGQLLKGSQRPSGGGIW